MNQEIDTQFWHFSNQHGWVVLNRVASSEPCPLCAGVLHRAPRRLIDRLFSLRQRWFLCASQDCDWEGGLATACASPSSSGA
jgi:hypothetical protein